MLALGRRRTQVLEIGHMDLLSFPLKPVPRGRLYDRINSFFEGKYPKYVEFREDEIRDVCSDVREIFMRQPMLLELEAPLKWVHLMPSSQILCH